MELAVARTPQACTDFNIPLQLLVRVCLDLAPEMLTDRSCMLRNIIGRQRTPAAPQISPTFLDFGELQRVQPLCLGRVPCTQTEALLALP
jgi:hypothetical protein